MRFWWPFDDQTSICMLIQRPIGPDRQWALTFNGPAHGRPSSIELSLGEIIPSRGFELATCSFRRCHHARQSLTAPRRPVKGNLVTPNRPATRDFFFWLPEPSMTPRLTRGAPFPLRETENKKEAACGYTWRRYHLGVCGWCSRVVTATLMPRSFFSARKFSLFW